LNFYILVLLILTTAVSCSSPTKNWDFQSLETLDKSCRGGSSGACALAGKKAPSGHPVPILQGITSEHQTRFTVQASKASWLYFVREAQSIKRLEPHLVSNSGSSLYEVTLEAYDLDPAKAYELLIIDGSGDLVDQRDFRSLDLKKKRARIAVASCLDDAFRSEQEKIWKQVMAQSPDAIFLIGDNVYADRGGSALTKEALWKRYSETRGTLSLFYADPLIPVIATWDDHDYGRNDGDRTSTLKTAATEVFFDFFPQSKPMENFERGPGVASWWSAFGVGFAFMDDRSFRSPNRINLPDETHFGADQEVWLKEKLDASKTPVLLISGDQFFGGYHKYESYEGSHPHRFKTQLQEWKQIKQPIVFLSGDRHLTEILKIPSDRLGYTTYEITSSAIHARTDKSTITKNPTPLRIAGAAGVHNYALIEIMRADMGLLQLDVQAFTQNKQLLFQKTLTVRRP
jgi:phosphodiesterase/alkaline phosphatase D-like protein